MDCCLIRKGFVVLIMDDFELFQIFEIQTFRISSQKEFAELMEHWAVPNGSKLAATLFFKRVGI